MPYSSTIYSPSNWHNHQRSSSSTNISSSWILPWSATSTNSSSIHSPRSRTCSSKVSTTSFWRHHASRRRWIRGWSLWRSRFFFLLSRSSIAGMLLSRSTSNPWPRCSLRLQPSSTLLWLVRHNHLQLILHWAKYWMWCNPGNTLLGTGEGS